MRNINIISHNLIVKLIYIGSFLNIKSTPIKLYDFADVFKFKNRHNAYFYKIKKTSLHLLGLLGVYLKLTIYLVQYLVNEYNNIKILLILKILFYLIIFFFVIPLIICTYCKTLIIIYTKCSKIHKGTAFIKSSIKKPLMILCMMVS